MAQHPRKGDAHGGATTHCQGRVEGLGTPKSASKSAFFAETYYYHGLLGIIQGQTTQSLPSPESSTSHEALTASAAPLRPRPESTTAPSAPSSKARPRPSRARSETCGCCSSSPSRWCTSCSVFYTRVTSTPSPFSRVCLRPVSAR